MCYEETLFRSWAKKKARQREETTVIERTGPAVQPIRPAPQPEIPRRKESERELEETV